jgi:hypothetical protein
LKTERNDIWKPEAHSLPSCPNRENLGDGLSQSYHVSQYAVEDDGNLETLESVLQKTISKTERTTKEYCHHVKGLTRENKRKGESKGRAKGREIEGRERMARDT